MVIIAELDGYRMVLWYNLGRMLASMHPEQNMASVVEEGAV